MARRVWTRRESWQPSRWGFALAAGALVAFFANEFTVDWRSVHAASLLAAVAGLLAGFRGVGRSG